MIDPDNPTVLPRIGILGGSFDPPHRGHLALAEAALAALELDEILWIPARRNPHKPARGQTPPKHRLEMVRRMVAGHDRMAVSDIEVLRDGPSYTVETLQELSLVRPAAYWLLMGADTLRGFLEWKHPEKIVRMARLGVVVRPPDTWADVLARTPANLAAVVDQVPMPPVDTSSTEIRFRLERGRPVGPWVAPEVLKYIESHGLYQSK
ncbi:MAG: nicotinate-nucleotide adenylyltransferase [Fimbriimonadaceae bacterium]